jgi:SAM-dependent methyltransferase
MTDQSTIAKPIGSPMGAFNQAIDALKGAGAKTVLDLPAGEGFFANMLTDNGFEPTCCDVFPDQFRGRDTTCQFVDLNKTIPFEDQTFDAITCLNGLERVWARGDAMREFSRVIKPGGTIIISYPNQGDMRRRMLNLFTGSVTWNVVGPPHVCDPSISPPESNFRYAMTTANVLTGLESTGFDLVSLKATHYNKSSMLMSPFALFPIAARLFGGASQQERYKLKENASVDALFGSFLVAVAKRNDTPVIVPDGDRGETNR